jgi:hypothetical protein
MTTTKFKDETKIGEQWDLAKIVPYEKNAKRHPKEQVEKLSKAISKLGWRSRIVVDKDGVIIQGHGRFEAAKFLGLKTAPVTVVSDLSDIQVKMLRLTDNEMVSNDYDTRLKAEELGLIHNEFDTDLSWAFSERDLDFALEDNGEINFDAISDSMLEEMEDMQGQTEKRIGDLEVAEIPISKVFSFTRVTGEQARQLTLLEKLAEAETGLKGSEALSAYSIHLLSA